MAQFTRSNAWNSGGTFANEDLLWYARGIGVMQSRALNDSNSWWFYAAIHGEYIRFTRYPGWGFVPGPPQVPTTPLPSQGDRDLYWDQCQHQTWYFPPWHRGYLVALEAQIRAAVKGLGGPSNWALPYWNYFGPGDEYKIPPAFLEENLPNGDPNPLFVKARYGPKGDGNIFVEIGVGQLTQKCQTNTVYTGHNSATLAPGYGGPETFFAHAGPSSGRMEDNPHNGVHVDVGGYDDAIKESGLMSSTGTAALDPIFYLHHSNIDRMWAEWNANGNSNPTVSKWLNGPAAAGERAFVMPMPDGKSWVYTPADVTNLNQMDYDYEGLAVAIPVQPAAALLTQRLNRLNAVPVPAAQGDNMDDEDDSELLGSDDQDHPITSSGARATVKLDNNVRQKVSESLAGASETAPPDSVYLDLENVRGTQDGNKLQVYVNDHLVETVALFGLQTASTKDGQHGGEGLNFLVDITDVIDSLHLEGALDVESLDVRIMPIHAVPSGDDLSVGKVSVYRQGHR